MSAASEPAALDDRRRVAEPGAPVQTVPAAAARCGDRSDTTAQPAVLNMAAAGPVAVVGPGSPAGWFVAVSGRFALQPNPKPDPEPNPVPGGVRRGVAAIQIAAAVARPDGRASVDPPGVNRSRRLTS